MEHEWLKVLDDDDLEFIHQFILCSGSLKELSRYYGVSYPTIRARADKLIGKISLCDESEDPYVAYIKTMAIEGKISASAAKEIINMFRLLKKGDLCQIHS